MKNILNKMLQLKTLKTVILTVATILTFSTTSALAIDPYHNQGSTLTNIKITGNQATADVTNPGTNSLPITLSSDGLSGEQFQFSAKETDASGNEYSWIVSFTPLDATSNPAPNPAMSVTWFLYDDASAGPLATGTVSGVSVPTSIAYKPGAGAGTGGGTGAGSGAGASSGSSSAAEGITPEQSNALLKLLLKITLIFAAAFVPLTLGDKLASAISNKINNATKGMKDNAWKTSGLGSYLEGKKRLKMEQGKNKALERIGTTGLKNRLARAKVGGFDGERFRNSGLGKALGVDRAYLTAESARGQALQAYTKEIEDMPKEAKMSYLRRYATNGGQNFDEKGFNKDMRAQAMVASLSDAKLVNDNKEPQFNYLNEMRGHMVGLGYGSVIGTTKEAGGADYLTDASLKTGWQGHMGMWVSGQRHTPEQANKFGTDNSDHMVERYEDLSAQVEGKGRLANQDYVQIGENHEADKSLGLAPGTGKYEMRIKGHAIADGGNYTVKDLSNDQLVTRKVGDGKDDKGWHEQGVKTKMQNTWDMGTVENDLTSDKGGYRVRNKVYTDNFMKYFLKDKVRDRAMELKGIAKDTGRAAMPVSDATGSARDVDNPPPPQGGGGASGGNSGSGNRAA